MNSFIHSRIIKTNYLLVILSFLFFSQPKLFSQGFTVVDAITPLIATTTTEDKPQSKLWEYGGYWWAVIPVQAAGSDPAGTYIYRLDGNTWTKLIRISTAIDRRADVHSVNNVTHIILRRTSVGAVRDIQLISIEFVPGSSPTYQPWVVRPNLVTILNYNGFSEAATIDIDSQNRMWLAYDGGGLLNTSNQFILVRSSEYPYSSWPTSSDTLTEADTAEVHVDDICTITAFAGNKIGVLWSDQNARQFRFRYRNDNDPLSTWSSVEIAASGSAPGLGVADDHGNLATTVDGTIYAAIKTGYNTSGTTRIGLLVRRTSGTWDPLYPVVVAGTNSDGSRPMLLLNEADEILTVVYTSAESGPHIRYKESPLAPISFPAKFHNLTFGSASFNNSTSTKQNVGNEPTIIYASSVGGSLYSWAGVKLSRTPLDTDDGAGYSFNFTDAAFPENKAISISTINLTLNIQGNTSITIEAWVNINSLKNQSILNKIAQSGQTAYELGLTSSGKIYFKINTDSLASASNYALDEWIHIAAVYNLSDMRLYINGKLDNWMVRTGTIPSNTRAVLIGAKRVGSTTPEVFNQGFDGSMDEVRVWAAVRTETQIQNNMCKKLQGTQTELRGYWRFDEPYGLTVPDYSGNDNYGSIFNLKDFRYTWSGAPIGDFTAVDFDPSGGFSQSISHSDGDTITATITGGTEAVTGLLLYRVDSPALRDSIAGLPPDTSPYEGNDPFRFWGVKVFGTGSYTMDVTYDFSGHPGIIDESLLDLVHRDNPSENGWDELFTIVDEDLNTLSITMVKDGEFSLASSGVNPLPVELSLFTARFNGTKILLNWRTETEVRNYGFDIERSSDGIEFYKLDFIEGHGNSNSPKLYSYVDPADGFTGKVYYRLKQIDTDGTFSYSKIISVDLGAPVTYELFQNYPNPFNPVTTIRYQIPEKTMVSIKVYNSIGEQVAVLVNEEKEPGYYELNFNAQNLASGLYIYNISASGFNTSKKMLLLK